MLRERGIVTEELLKTERDRQPVAKLSMKINDHFLFIF
jgi:hypothetical protein